MLEERSGSRREFIIEFVVSLGCAREVKAKCVPGAFLITASKSKNCANATFMFTVGEDGMRYFIYNDEFHSNDTSCYRYFSLDDDVTTRLLAALHSLLLRVFFRCSLNRQSRARKKKAEA